MKKEIWKKVPGASNYEASNYGKVRIINYRGTNKAKELKQSNDKDGYKRAFMNGKTVSVHRIIAKTFLKNYNEVLQVNHINGNKKDNNIRNIEMVTSKENSMHRTKILKKGRIKPVIMLEKNTMNVIKEFDSTREAERQTNICHSTISKVCLGKKKSAGGYFWKYKKEDIK